MPAQIRIVNMYTECESAWVVGPFSPNGVVVDTTSKAGWSSDLSPFKIGPVELYNGHVAANVENAWQFAKVYADVGHTDEHGNPNGRYWRWAIQGWADPKPHRYPMGRGAVPLYSWWESNRLGYIDARKQIYGPLYAQAVQRTQGWETLVRLYQASDLLILRDYDGYDHDAKGETLTEVLNNPRKKMGHAFVLKMLLTQDPALREMRLRS